MIVTLTEVGGWANLRRSCTVDTASLPDPLALKLEEGCRAVLMAVPGTHNPHLRDGRTLTLVVDLNGAPQSVTFVEPGAPPELQPVLEILRPLCRLASRQG